MDGWIINVLILFHVQIMEVLQKVHVRISIQSVHIILIQKNVLDMIKLLHKLAQKHHKINVIWDLMEFVNIQMINVLYSLVVKVYPIFHMDVFRHNHIVFLTAKLNYVNHRLDVRILCVTDVNLHLME